MFCKHSLLALIPARSGSKGLPDKNIINCAGKPLINWSISAAKNVDFFDDVLVSTDSVKIADLARHAGASVPFLRPDEFATDDASIVDVVKHAWKNHLAPNGEYFDYIRCVPNFRTREPVATILRFFKNREWIICETKDSRPGHPITTYWYYL